MTEETQKVRSGIKREGLLFCLVGPAGGGKTTLYEQLLQEFAESTRRSVSLTTRTPRPQEREGLSYHFVTRTEFDARIQRGELFEWEEVHGNLYGTPRTVLDQAIRDGCDLLLEVDIRGALRFQREYPRTTVITFVVPSSPSILRGRIENRSKVSPEEISRRLKTAQHEYETFLSGAREGNGVDYLVINEGFESAYATVRSILLAERARVSRLSFETLRKLCAVDERI